MVTKALSRETISIYSYFSSAESNEAQLLKMLLQGEFTLLGATYKAEYAQSAVTTVPKLQQMYDAFMQHEGKPRATITEGPLKHVLGLASNSLPHDQKYVYVKKQDYYKCKECGEDVNKQTASASPCTDGCATQCLPGCRDQSKVTKSSRAIAPKIIKHLRISNNVGSMAPDDGAAAAAASGVSA